MLVPAFHLCCVRHSGRTPGELALHHHRYDLVPNPGQTSVCVTKEEQEKQRKTGENTAQLLQWKIRLCPSDHQVQPAAPATPPAPPLALNFSFQTRLLQTIKQINRGMFSLLSAPAQLSVASPSRHTPSTWLMSPSIIMAFTASA